MTNTAILASAQMYAVGTHGDRCADWRCTGWFEYADRLARSGDH